MMIERFRTEDQEPVRALILDGLQEHWGTLDSGLNADLEDIEANFADGVVLVVRDADRVVGVGAIVPIAQGEGEVKRMSVAQGSRRKGIGAALLRGLVGAAEQRGWHAVRLETTADWEDAVGFYSAFGFELTHYEDGPFCRDAHFRLAISPETATP
jgi:GNAT superfamily N-acetyltransferase